MLEAEVTELARTVTIEGAAILREPPLMLDRVQIEQVLVNLQLNGLEAMERPR